MKFHSRFNIDKYPISSNKITKILFTNVIDIHSTNHLYLINFTYLATLRIHLEERIARHEDRLKSKKKKKMRMKKIFRGSESTYFRMTSNGTFQKGRLLAWRGEKWGGRLSSEEEGRKGEQARTRKEKKAGRQVGKSDESSWLVACGEVDGGTVVRCKVNGLEPSRIQVQGTWLLPGFFLDRFRNISIRPSFERRRKIVVAHLDNRRSTLGANSCEQSCYRWRNTVCNFCRSYCNTRWWSNVSRHISLHRDSTRRSCCRSPTL